MRYIFTKPDSWLRKIAPLIQETRRWSWKYFDRIALRLVISGGRVRFMDADLNFPEGVGLTYSSSLFWSGPEAYETATSRVLALLLSRSQSFLDIGSNIGIYAVYAGVKYPDMMIFAFEPVPVIWSKNVEFHRANSLSEAIVLKLALSDEEKVEKFFLPLSTDGIEEEQTGTLNTKSWQTSASRLETFDVQCTTLDRFTSVHAFPPGGCCLKIDVENHEASVLKGGRQFILARRPWIVCEILYGQQIDPSTGKQLNENREIVKMIEELAYVPFAITNDGLFRMSHPDFEKPRLLKDFLLVPQETATADVSYLPLSSLEELLPLP